MYQMKLLVTLLMVLVGTGSTYCQEVVIVGPLPAPSDLPEWALSLPEVEYCVKRAASEFDNGNGSVIRTLEYEGPDVVQFVGRSDSCATIRLEFSYPFTSPPTSPPPKLTKQQRRQIEQAEKRGRQTSKELRKFHEKFSFLYPKPAPPRHFVLKSFSATQYFPTPCDYTPCPLRTIVLIRFSPGGTLHLEAGRPYEQVEAFLNRIDFGALNLEINKWIESRTRRDKNERPPVSERPGITPY